MIPDSHKDLLEEPLIAHVATLRPDGSAQSNPTWFDWDGRRLRLSGTKSRQKFQNLRRDPRVAVSMVDRDNPYRYLEVRGEVEEIEADPSRAFINSLAQRYLGQDEYSGDPPGEERVIFVIRPTGSSSMN